MPQVNLSTRNVNTFDFANFPWIRGEAVDAARSARRYAYIGGTLSVAGIITILALIAISTAIAHYYGSDLYALNLLSIGFGMFSLVTAAFTGSFAFIARERKVLSEADDYTQVDQDSIYCAFIWHAREIEKWQQLPDEERNDTAIAVEIQKIRTVAQQRGLDSGYLAYLLNEL